MWFLTQPSKTLSMAAGSGGPASGGGGVLSVVGSPTHPTKRSKSPGGETGTSSPPVPVPVF